MLASSLSVENTSVISSCRGRRRPLRRLHGLEHVDAELGVAHADLLQRLVLVAALSHVLLVQDVVTCRLCLQLRRRQISTQRLRVKHTHIRYSITRPHSNQINNQVTTAATPRRLWGIMHPI